ncbi:MAG: hypothetical protein IKG46_09900 [Solobacterium sp.]|nr:hypothetical protein [Solobacterium sp.]
MKKRCTESTCRRVFVIRGRIPACPYCGRQYPRLTGPVTHWVLNISGFPEKKRAVLALCRHTPMNFAEAFSAFCDGHGSITFDTLTEANSTAEKLRSTGFRVAVNHSYE